MKDLALSSEYKDTVNQQNVADLLFKAAGTWKMQAPKSDDPYAKEVGRLFRYKSKQIMDKAYQYLFQIHKSNYFPYPAKWVEALKIH